MMMPLVSDPSIAACLLLLVAVAGAWLYLFRDPE